MCLIIDANVACLIFSGTPDAAFQPILDALRKKKAVAVHGGHLTTEYSRIGRIRRILIELGRQGVLRKVPDDQVVAETALYHARPIQSDDPHILGLAKIAKVRLLCSHDQNLHADFTNPDLLSPRGMVYQNASHRFLIRQNCGSSRPHKRRTRTKKYGATISLRYAIVGNVLASGIPLENSRLAWVCRC